MTKLNYEYKDTFHAIDLNEGETVLEGLLRQGFDTPNACRSGVCQTCLMQATEPSIVPEIAQKGLKNSQKELGKFLACCCIPKEEITIRSNSQKYVARVLTKQLLGDSVIRLRLSKPFDYTAGQYVTIETPEGEGRCYSIVSHPVKDDYIEFHLRHYPDGVVSHWVHSELKQDDLVNLYSPVGDCVYQSTDLNQTLYFAGIGTGAGVLTGIVRDAINRGHKGKIKFLIGGLTSKSFYLKQELDKLRSHGIDIHQVALEMNSDVSQSYFKADVYEYAKNLFTDLKDAKIYLCGASSFVQKMRKQCFLAGAAMNNIHADAFAPPSAS